MLKPAEPSPPEPDRSIGETIERAVRRRSRLMVAPSSICSRRARSSSSRIMCRAAILFAIAGGVRARWIVTLFVGIAIALARWIGPLGGAIVSTLIAAGIAGLLVWLATSRSQGAANERRARSGRPNSRSTGLAPRLLGTLATSLSRQFEPHRLMQEVWEKAKDKGADLAEDAVDAVRARPLAATGVVAAITMFLARESLMDPAGKFVGGTKGKSTKAPKSAGTKIKRRQPNDRPGHDTQPPRRIRTRRAPACDRGL